MQGEKKSYFLDVIDILRLLYKWKFILLLIGIVTGILAYIFSGPKFITPKYKATAVFYPTANSSFSQSLIDPNYITQKRPMDYGEKEEGEQITQILKSDAFALGIIKKFKLYEHYGFDTTKFWSPTVLKIMFKKNFSVERTDYMAVQVEVLDKDPEFAFEMANYACELADIMKNSLYKQKAERSFLVAQSAYLEKYHYIDSLNHLLTDLRKDGIYEYKTQVEQLYGSLVKAKDLLTSETAKLKVYEENKNSIPDSTIVKTKARIKGAEASIKTLEPSLKNLGNRGGQYNDVLVKLEFEQEKLSKLKQAYEQARIDFEVNIPRKYIVSPAEYPDIPSLPRRMMIVYITAIASIFLSFAIILFFENLWPAIHKKAN